MIAAPQREDETYAEVVRERAGIERVHVQGAWIRPTSGVTEVWVLTDPLTDEQELAMYALEDDLWERLPDANPEVHIVHADMYDTDHFVYTPPYGGHQVYAPPVAA